MEFMEVIMIKNIKLLVLGSLLVAPTITQPAIFTYEQMRNVVASTKVKAGLGYEIEYLKYIPFKIGVGLDGVKLGFNFKGHDKVRFELAKAVIAVLFAGYNWYTLPGQTSAVAKPSAPISAPNAQ
jgi:hypothetical protein